MRVVLALVLSCLVAVSTLPLLRPAPAADAPTPGPVRFREHLIRGGYGYAYGVVAADLDGDGKLDLTSCDTVGNALYWFANDGKGGFTRHVIRDNETGWFERHAVADLDGDGKPDVAASAWKGNQLAWFANPGKPGADWVRHSLDEGPAETRTIRVADFNGDGRPDLLATASAAPLVAWYESPGPGGKAWVRHVIDDRSPRPMHGHAIDMDGDGDPDVVMALGMMAPDGAKETHQVVWYENIGRPGKGREWKKHVIGELPGAFEAYAADLNGDGKPDVAATSWSEHGKVVWFENPGDPAGKWTKHVLKEDWPRANQVIVADLDADRRPDIIATAERGANELRWWRNEGPEK